MLTKRDRIAVNTSEIDEEFVRCVSITTTVDLRKWKVMTVEEALSYAKTFSFKGIKYQLSSGNYEYIYVSDKLC